MKTNLSLIDTHCDTAFELYHRKQSIFENNCHVSLQKAEKFENYTHFFAVWADRKRTDDDCYNDFLAISDNLFAEIEKHSHKVAQVRSFAEMQAAHNSGKGAIFLAVEDARILGNKIERLDELKARGVAYLTLLWGGATCIGASHNAEGGLTEFGREVVKKCFELGIVPDVSHANEQVTDEVTELAFEYGKAGSGDAVENYMYFRTGEMDGVSSCIAFIPELGIGVSVMARGEAELADFAAELLMAIR